MKKTLKILLASLLIIIMMLSFTACGESGKIKKTISGFQTACNASDVNAMLDFIDPSVSDVVRTASGFLGALSGQDSTAVLTSLSSLLLKGSDVAGLEFFTTLDIKVGKVAVLETTGDAQVELSYAGAGGGTVTRNAVIHCILDAETWYIRGFDFVG